MAAAAGVNPTRSIDRYISFGEGISQKVDVQILQGDITTGDTQAVVVFRNRDGTAEGDSLRVLQTAGPVVDTEYQNVKGQGGRDVAKGVVLTRAGNLLKPKYILHVHLLVDYNFAKFRQALITALRVAEGLTLQSIAFPSLPDHLGDFEQVSNNKQMLESFEQFATVDRPICLHFIQVVLFKNNNPMLAEMAAEKKRQQEQETYRTLMENIQMMEGVRAVDGRPQGHYRSSNNRCTIS